MSKAVIYARVSSKDQEREGYSIPAQLHLLAEYAQKHGFTVAKQFSDSETAKSIGRTSFGQMVEYLKSHKDVRTILVEKTDRLYRNFKDYTGLEELDLVIHLVKEGELISKDSKSHAKFIHGIRVLMAKNYSDNLSEEVKKGQLQKASEGKYPGGMVPTGYRQNPDTKEIEIDPVKGPIIRQMFEMYAAGDCSLEKIHSFTKKSGLTFNRSGRLIPLSEVERILKKEFYCGKFLWSGSVYQGDHPAIVDPLLFEAVQQQFKRRSNGKFSKRDFLFSRMVNCGICGNLVTAEIKKQRFVYYHCTGFGTDHELEYVPEPKLDQMFAEIVGKVTLPWEFYGFLKERLEEESRTKKITVARERDRLETEREKIQTSMKKAFQSHIDGHVSNEFFQGVYNDYQKQLEAVNYRLENLSESVTRDFDMASQAIELSYQAESLYLKATPDQKRRLLKSLLSNSSLRDGTLHPTYGKPFDVLAEGIKSGDKRRGRDSNPRYPKV